MGAVTAAASAPSVCRVQPVWVLLQRPSPGPTSGSAPLQGSVGSVLSGESCSELSSSVGFGMFGCRVESSQLDLPAGLSGRVFTGKMSCCLLPWLTSAEFGNLEIVC